MIAVLDTNILISAVFWRGGLPYNVVLNGLKKKYSIYLSPQILNELEEKLRIKFKFPENEIQNHIEVLIEYGEIVEPSFTIDIIKNDPDDNKILECAASCNADYIVSGDSHLLDLNEYNGIKILSAKKFLELLEEN